MLEPTKNPILALPDELKDLIMQHIDSIDTLRQLLRVCRGLHAFISDPSELRRI